MTTPLIILGFVLSIVCAVLTALFLMAFYQKPFIKSFLYKGFASACFVALGAITCFTGEISITKLLIFIGLCFGLVGDEVIHLCQAFPERDSLAFIGGGLFFLVGHLLYILALLLLGGVNWISVLIAFAVLVSLSLVYAGRRKFLSGEMKIPLALYLGIVSFMACVAIGAFTERLTVGTGLFAVGGVLFTLSDNILFAYKMGEKPRFVQNVLLHAAYYIAQILIAWSLACL